MRIPDAIKKEAAHLVTDYGYQINFLGKRGKTEYYNLTLPEDCDTGFPIVYQYEDGKVLELPSFSALDVISLFVKD